jgi:hypothetical protein
MKQSRSNRPRLLASSSYRLSIEARLLLVSIGIVSLAGLAAVELSSF